MANFFASSSKSNRLLQSLRYTIATADNTEAYASVLDLNATEVYTQQNYVPSSSLPYSGSSQHLEFITASIGDPAEDVNIAQYYYRVQMTRSDRNLGNSKSQAWLAISGSGYDPSGESTDTQLISSNQLTDWLSNKYAAPSLAISNAEAPTPGYNVSVRVNGSAVTSGWQFDYKTGVLQFTSEADAPATTATVLVSGYRYVGQTLDSFISSSGDGTGVGFPFSGSAVITGSLIISGSNTNDDPELIVSGGLVVTEGITGSNANFSTGTINTLTGTDATFDTLKVNTFISSSTLITSGSNVFGDTVVLNNLTNSTKNSFDIAGVTPGAIADVKSSDLNVTASFNFTNATTLAEEPTLVQAVGTFAVGNVVTFTSQSLGAATAGGTDLTLTLIQSNLSSNDTQTLIGSNIFITGSTDIDGNLDVNGTLGITGFSDVSASLAAATAGTGIFDQQGSTDVYKTDKQLLISSSAPLMATPYSGSNPTVANDGTDGTATKYSVVSSQSGWFYNHNVGVPKSKAWGTDLDGSYFNNFNHNTDTSEILRFIAGLLKDQAPDVQPNTKTFSSVAIDDEANTSQTSPNIGFIPLGYQTGVTNTTYDYLNSKGFAEPGKAIFHNVSGNPYSNVNGYSRAFKSVATGTTTVTSSVNTELFGLGNIGTLFAVSSSATWKYADDSDRTDINTNTSSSVRIKATGSGLSTVAEFIYAPIPTGNDLISPTFQDGLFGNAGNSGKPGIFPISIADPIGETGFPTNLTGNASIGYYQLTSSIKVDYNNTSDTSINKVEIFYAPMNTINATFTPAQTVSYTNTSLTALTLTSRSLGRAPYVDGGTWKSGAQVNNLFNPLYAGGTSNVVSTTATGVSITPSSAGVGQRTLSTNTSGQVTTADVLFDSTGTSARGANTVPTIDDVAIVTQSIAFAPTTSQTNITQTGFGSNNFTATVSSKIPSGTSIIAGTANSITGKYFDTSNPFGSTNPLDNADIMAYFGGSETDQVGSNTNSTEAFKSDVFRKKINDNLLPGNTADAYSNGGYEADVALATADLQVKPGFLVKPGGANGYWLTSNTGITAGTQNGGARFYAREFQYTGAAQPIKELVFNFGSNVTLDADSTGNTSKWENPTADSISVLVYRKSNNSGNIFVDLADYAGSDPGSQSTSTAQNPFGSSIDVKSNANSSALQTGASAGEYYLQTTATKFQQMQTNDVLGVLVRYNGDPSSVIQSIGVTYSTG